MAEIGLEKRIKFSESWLEKRTNTVRIGLEKQTKFAEIRLEKRTSYDIVYGANQTEVPYDQAENKKTYT